MGLSDATLRYGRRHAKPRHCLAHASLEEAKDVRASKTEVEATLHWKERKAFMTRNTQILALLD